MPIFRKLSDEHIVRRVLAGRSEEYAQLVDRYLPIVHAVAFAQMGNHADAEDVAQDALIKAYQALDTLREVNKFGPWLLTITRNTCTRYLRVRLRHTGRGRALSDTPAVNPPDMEGAELHEMLRRQIVELEAGAREVLLLHYFAGKRTPEIAELLGISVEAVKKRLQRARESLSIRMEDELSAVLAPPRATRERARRIMGVVGLTVPSWMTGRGGLTTGSSGGAWAGGLATPKAAFAGLAALAVASGSWLWVQRAPEAPHGPIPHVEARTVAGSDAQTLPPPASKSSLPAPRPAGDEPSENGADVALSAPSIASLEGSGVMYGRITGPDGGTAAGASVVGYHRPLDSNDNYSLFTPDYRSETQTDERGEFRLTDLPWGEYRIIARKDNMFGLRTVRIDEDVPSRFAEMDIEPAGFISGRVLDESNAPVAGARVFPYVKRLEGREFTPPWGTMLSVFSDADGSFSVGPVFRDDWKLLVAAQGYAVATTRYLPIDTSGFQVTLTRGRTLSGGVVDETGTAVPDVEVCVVQDGVPRNRCAAVSGPDGSFECQRLSPGSYTVVVTPGQPWVSDGTPPSLVVSPTNDLSDVRVPVTQGGRISGTVTHAHTHKGLQGVQVTARLSERTSTSPEVRDSQPRRSAATDAEGRYEIVGLPDAEYELSASSDQGFLAADAQWATRVRVQTGQHQTGIDFTLVEGLTVSGTVRDAQGNPVENATVQGRSYDHRFTHGKSDGDGAFVLKGLRQTSWFTVSARAPGRRSEAYGPVGLGEGGLQDVELVLDETCIVAGRIVDGQGKGLEGVLVGYMSEKPLPAYSHPVLNISGPAGAFVFNDLLPGTYVFTTGLPGSLADRRQVTIEAGQDVTDIVLNHPTPGELTLSGRVLDAQGKPIKGATVFADGPTIGSAETNEAGEFVVSRLQEGRYRIKAWHGEFAPTPAVEVDAGTPGIELMLEGVGALEGSVTAGDTKLPLQEFEMAVLPGASKSDVAGGHASYRHIHDKDGRFRLDKIYTGSVVVVARANGYAPTAVPVEGIRPGETVKGVSVVLEKGLTLRGTVVNADAQPVSGAGIFAGRDTTGWQRDGAPLTTTAEDGSFELDGLSATVGAVFAHAEGYAPAGTVVVLGPGVQPVRIVLQRGGSLEGVVTLDGAPVGGARVTVEYGSSSPDIGIAAPAAVTSADGRYELTGLMPGQMTVSAALPDSEAVRSQQQEAIVAGDSITTADFHFTAGNSVLEGTVKIKGVAPLLTQVSVTVTTPAGSRESYEQVVRGRDIFRIEGVASGRAQLTVHATGESTVYQRRAEFDIPVGQTVHQDIGLGDDDHTDPHQGIQPDPWLDDSAAGM